jgi:hypothetical protein
MIRKILSALCISACLPEMAAAQQTHFKQQLYTGTGAYSQSQTDLFSGFHQTAALASLKVPAAGVTGMRPYLISALSRYQIQVAFPVSSGVMGLKGDLRGNAGYREQQVGFSYARKLGAKLSTGLCFTYNSIRIDGYGQAAMPGVEAGLILHVTNELHTGIQLINPVSGKWGIGKKEPLPAVYVFGLGYEASSVFYCSAEIIKEEEQPASVHVSFQYKPITRLLLRAGMGTGTSVTWAGAGFQLSRCRFDLFVSFHPQLGFTPGTGILFQLKK